MANAYGFAQQIKKDRVPDGYMTTEAGVLPVEWRAEKMSILIRKLTQAAGEDIYETVSISAGKGFVNQAQKFGKELSGKQYEKYIVLHKGDFSYNKGNSTVYPQGCIYRLRDRESVAVPNVFESFSVEHGDPDYYEQLFISGFLNKQLYSKINRGVRENGLLNLTGDDFYSCSVPVPPLPEQQKIAEVLLQCDKVIELKLQRIEAEHKKKRWLMENLLNPNGSVRLAGFSGGWNKSTVGSVAQMFSGGTPTSSNRAFYADAGIPFIRSGEIAATETELFLSQDGFDKSSAKMVYKGDLLYALYGANSGECAISKIDGAINQAILCIRSNIININFLYYALSYKKAQIVSTYLQGGQGNLSGEIVKNLSITFPNMDEQKAICSVINAQDTVIEKLEMELTYYLQKKKALMQLLLTGIVRVNLQ